MAEGRMLKRKISVSEQVADLLNDTHRLLFTWGIAHLDVDGRMSANPRKFKALICPMLDHITVETIKSFFADVQRLGLIDVYEADGDWWMCYPTFGDHQKLRADREAKCVIPQSTEVKWITPGELPELSRITPPKVKVSKDKEDKGVNKTPPAKNNTSKKANLTDEEFIQELHKNKAFRGIDIDRELGKMDLWFQTPKGKGKSKTRRFMLNWLSKCEIPVGYVEPEEKCSPERVQEILRKETEEWKKDQERRAKESPLAGMTPEQITAQFKEKMARMMNNEPKLPEASEDEPARSGE